MNGTLVFRHISDSLQRPSIKTKVSQQDYTCFCEGYLFDAIKGKRFGQAFCERFNIVDYILLIEPSTEYSKNYIIKAGYVTK